MDSATKVCTKCGERKTFAMFSADPKGGGGKRARCKQCTAQDRIPYYGSNKNRILEGSKKWKASHTESERERIRNWLKTNPQAASKIRKKWYSENMDSVQRYNRTKSQAMPDAYIANQVGLQLSLCPPYLINLKREQLTIHRLSKQLKSQLKEVSK